MNNSMIINLLIMMMYTVYARVEMCDIKTIGETVVIEEDNLLVHPDGPLNPLRGYIMHTSGYMYNKRFYTPEINTMYKLEKTDKLTASGKLIYKYTRKPVNDEVYSDICEENKKNEYLIQFHTQLIKIFPSSDESLSIVSGVSDGLTSFLVKDKVTPQNMYILAVLFILSEQVDIPINICIEKEKKLVLKSTDGKDTYIDQSLFIYEKGQTQSKNNLKKWCKDIKNLIKFLKAYIENDSTNPSVMKGLLSVPTTYEQFKTGEFLNTPQFLVQSYIYEFIDTKDNYIKFIEAVYTLLTDQINNENSTAGNRARSNELLNRCFIEESKLSYVTNHTEIISNLIKKINSRRACPFINGTELPAYARVKSYDRTCDKTMNDEDTKYSSCVESGILGLVCCLMYDPETGRYNTNHLPNKKETAPLKKFFRKHSVLTETTNQEMNQDWCKVVADLKNSKVLYLKQGTNELDSSLLNILYVVSDITGNKKEVLKEIESIKSMCNNTEQLDIELTIRKSLTNIFTELSNNKNIEVESKPFKVGKREDKKPDLFGSFSLFYNFNDIRNGISMDISVQHTSLDLVGDIFSSEDKKIVKESFINAQSEYRTPVSYTECIIKHYIDLELIKITGSNEYLVSFIQMIHLDSINTGGTDVFKMFLYGKIVTTVCKEYIVMHFLLLYTKKSLKDNSLIRITDNLIGSTPLDDTHTRNRMLRGLICHPRAKEYYTKIENSIWNDFIDDSMQFSGLIRYLYCYVSNIDIITCLTELIRTAANSKNNYIIIMSNISAIANILDKELYESRNFKDREFYHIIDIIKESCKEMDMHKLTDIYLSLLLKHTYTMLRGFYRNPTVYERVIIYLFNIIDDKYLIVENKPYIDCYSSFLPKILEYLKVNGEVLFCYNTRNIEKYNKIIEIINIKISI
ncbi:hypothetical protein NEIG_02312 [Nematocida sp. ERTm5]|nr:hypothetical protein NEIG_02312 [Nematocida sp. ERTm5]